MSKSIGLDQLSKAINRELTIYNQNIVDGIKKASKKSMSQLVKDTRATAPVGNRQGKYRDAISSKKVLETERAVSYLWYVKGSEYRLSHLLERGHATRDGGRTKAFRFIENASEPILKDYEETVEKVIKDG